MKTIFSKMLFVLLKEITTFSNYPLKEKNIKLVIISQLYSIYWDKVYSSDRDKILSRQLTLTF